MEKLKNVFSLMNLSMCYFEENWDDGSIVHHCCCGKVIMKKSMNDKNDEKCDEKEKKKMKNESTVIKMKELFEGRCKKSPALKKTRGSVENKSLTPMKRRVCVKNSIQKSIKLFIDEKTMTQQKINEVWKKRDLK